MNRASILALMAARSLWAHKVKSAIVGGILFFGTFLVMTGSALLDSVEASMAKSITSSMAGHLQVYSKDAKDPLALFGQFGMGSSDIGEIDDFSKVKASLMTVPNVKAVVPMGITIATSFGGNDIDHVLEDFRDAVDHGDVARQKVDQDRVRHIAATIGSDYGKRAAMSSDPQKMQDDEAALARAQSDEFWADFDADPSGHLDWLDGHVAPLAADGQIMYLRTIGTDLDTFTKDFDRFYIVDGEMVPSGQRGFLLSKRTYEKFLKNLVARQLDDVKEAIDGGGTIAADPALQQEIKNNANQYTRITYQLAPGDAAELEPKLRALLHDDTSDLNGLVQSFLKVDDGDFAERYDFFYREIAPHVRLYQVGVGDTLTLRSYTKSGYARSVNVKIYGTYEFKGLEKSDLASASNLTDLVTWRDLYGKMSDDQLSELQDIKKTAGVQEVTAENAEDALFGGGGSIVADAAPSSGDAPAFDEFAGVKLAGRADRAQELDTKTYSREEFEKGLALNAAILLDDPSKLRQTQADIAAKSDADGLGLQVVDWETASGIVGQFIYVMRGVLWFSILVIYLVALVIINNAMVMATIERTPEIGTMRAVGAQRWFVVLLFLLETVVLGLVAGGLGAVASGALVGWLGVVGIPAKANILVMLFAGSRLYPSFGLSNVLFGLVSILLISVLSTLYPALVAARVPPIVAMQGKE